MPDCVTTRRPPADQATAAHRLHRWAQMKKVGWWGEHKLCGHLCNLWAQCLDNLWAPDHRRIPAIVADM